VLLLSMRPKPRDAPYNPNWTVVNKSPDWKVSVPGIAHLP